MSAQIRDPIGYEFLQCEGYCSRCGHESMTRDEFADHRKRCSVESSRDPSDAFDVPGNE